MAETILTAWLQAQKLQPLLKAGCIVKRPPLLQPRKLDWTKPLTR